MIKKPVLHGSYLEETQISQRRTYANLFCIPNKDRSFKVCFHQIISFGFILVFFFFRRVIRTILIFQCYQTILAYFSYLYYFFKSTVALKKILFGLYSNVFV